MHVSTPGFVIKNWNCLLKLRLCRLLEGRDCPLSKSFNGFPFTDLNNSPVLIWHKRHFMIWSPPFLALPLTTLLCLVIQPHLHSFRISNVPDLLTIAFAQSVSSAQCTLLHSSWLTPTLLVYFRYYLLWQPTLNLLLKSGLASFKHTFHFPHYRTSHIL